MDKSEYHRYLASREWALLKEQLRKRSKGRCERCWEGKYESTHHVTYERVGNEALDDLLAVCSACHKFLSGKSDKDPIKINLARNAQQAFNKANELSAVIMDLYVSAEIAKLQDCDPLDPDGALWAAIMELNKPFSRFTETVDWFLMEKEAKETNAQDRE